MGYKGKFFNSTDLSNKWFIYVYSPSSYRPKALTIYWPEDISGDKISPEFITIKFNIIEGNEHKNSRAKKEKKFNLSLKWKFIIL